MVFIGQFRLVIALCACAIAHGLSVGRGMADMTGLAAEGLLFGYANSDQDARGLHMRQYSRAFVFQDDRSDKRVAFVTAEITMISQALHLGVMEALERRFPNGRYDLNNVMLAPTHSHSLPGGYHTYWMYQTASAGAVSLTYEAAVSGIVRSIEAADADLQSARVLMNRGDLDGANLNRSPYAYQQNPEEERARYPSDVDKEMTLIKVLDANAGDLGAISFFPVHTTSLPNSNHLVSTDNKGIAAQLLERRINAGRYPQDVTFLAAFPETNLGDVTPRISGAYCNATDEQCDFRHSNCPADEYEPALCEGRGPGDDVFASNMIIGQRQADKAWELYNSASDRIEGPVDYRFQWVNMSSVVLEASQERLCRAAMGYSFAAGATDGPGAYGFMQGDLWGDPVLDSIVEELFGVPESLRECHAPKPVLLPTGTTDAFWDWQPDIVPVQLLRIGDVIIIGMPAEITTMSGRRTRKAVKQVLTDNGLPDTLHPIIISMANSYSSYVTTPEEYQVQRYEGASTIYGPQTLNGYIQVLSELGEAMAQDEQVALGAAPPDYREYPEEGLPSLRYDTLPTSCPGCDFGDVTRQPNNNYQQGEIASAVFIAGNPRHDLQTDGSFLTVEQETDEGWGTFLTDAHWETRFYWDSNCQDLDWEDETDGCDTQQTSTATVTWQIETGTPPARYRLRYTGHARYPDGAVRPVAGTSDSFQVTASRYSGEREREERERYGDAASAHTGDVLRDVLGKGWKGVI